LKIDEGCDRIKLQGFRPGGFDEATSPWPGGYDPAKGPISVHDGATRIGCRFVNLTAVGVDAGTTVYMAQGQAHASGVAGATQVTAPMQVIGMTAAAGVPAGTGDTFTYTLQKNGVDTTLYAQLAGAAMVLDKSKVTLPLPEHVFDEDDYYTVKLVNVGGEDTDHRVTLQVVDL
jgi:hypothetical protein